MSFQSPKQQCARDKKLRLGLSQLCREMAHESLHCVPCIKCHFICIIAIDVQCWITPSILYRAKIGGYCREELFILSSQRRKIVSQVALRFGSKLGSFTDLSKVRRPVSITLIR